MPSRLKRYQTFDQDHFITFTCYHRLPFLDDEHARNTFEEVLETLRERHQFRAMNGAPGKPKTSSRSMRSGLMTLLRSIVISFCGG